MLFDFLTQKNQNNLINKLHNFHFFLKTLNFIVKNVTSHAVKKVILKNIVKR